MNDQNQQQNLQQNQQVPQQNPVQSSIQNTPFVGGMPFTNVPKQNSNVQYVGGPESAPIQIQKESVNTPDQTVETKNNVEKAPEGDKGIERKEFKSPSYPQNSQPTQTAQLPIKPLPDTTPKYTPPKFFGYMVSPQIVNNFELIASQKGHGSPTKSRTWIYMLLDRILKKQTYIQK